jgi:hypothetical protein
MNMVLAVSVDHTTISSVSNGRWDIGLIVVLSVAAMLAFVYIDRVLTYVAHVVKGVLKDALAMWLVTVLVMGLAVVVLTT